MPMNTFTVDQLRGDTLAQAMRSLHANPRDLPDAYYSATVEPGVAMLVEPVNNDPFVFVPPNTVHRFESQPGSGTDKLRQRMEAGLFFNRVVDAKRAEAIHEAADESRVAAASRRAAP